MNVVDLHRKLILFDMDRTLIKLAEWYDRAYVLTVRAVYGLELPSFGEKPSYAGNTLANILRNICKQAGVETVVVEARLQEALVLLSGHVIGLLPADLRPFLLPGVLPLLAVLRSEGHLLGLVTGTDTAIVRTVLDRSGLVDYFPICACGDEGQDKSALMRLAVARALPYYGGRQLNRGDVVAVGDAPPDIEAGRSVGAWTVGVATGFHTAPDLAQFSPDVVLTGFEDQPCALWAIVGGPDNPANRPSTTESITGDLSHRDNEGMPG
jgi:phosphoglycolate phosphatase